MATSPSDVFPVARSRENDDLRSVEQPYIDLTKLEAEESKEQTPKDSAYVFKSNRKRNVLITIFIICTLVVAGAYSEIIIRGDKIAYGVSVDGISLGGKSETQAMKVVKENSADAINKPVTFKLAKDSISYSSQDLDLKYDEKQTVENVQAVGDSYNPVDVLAGSTLRYIARKNVRPSYTINKEKFDAVATAIENKFSSGRSDAGIKIDGTTVSVIEPKSGTGVSYKQAKKALEQSVSTYKRKPIVLKSEEVDAAVSLEEATNTAEKIKTMLSQDTTMTTPGGNTITVTPEQLSSALVIAPDGKKLKVTIDSNKIRTALASQLSGVETSPTDASFAVNGSSVSVIPSVAGKHIDFTSAVNELLAGKHSFAIGVIEVQPAHDTTWAQKLNITEAVSSFSTNFTAGQLRVKNIRRAAEVVNNTIVEPGEIFSLNNKLGKRTAENGYVKAPVYSDADGFFEDFGGGASQFSTTLFNAAFIGGYKDVTHSPHSIYIKRYPMGREATLNYGSIDMSFKNDTNSGILIRTSVGTTSVSVVLYGNKEGRTVKLEGPVELSRTEPTIKYTDDPNMAVGKEVQTHAGYPGIVVENYRTVDRPGQSGRRERYRWTYNMVPTEVTRGTKTTE